MKNTRILEMINNGEIDALKALLKEEIYKDSIKGSGDYKKRYSAMKRYFKFTNEYNPVLLKPCTDLHINKLGMMDGTYTSFFDGHSFTLTQENIGEMETYDNSKCDYLNMENLITFDGELESINLNDVLATSKSNGYKYTKKNIKEPVYICNYRSAYFNIALIDKAYSIIDDGKPADVYFLGSKSILTIKTSVGVCGILPLNPKFIENNTELDKSSFIKIESKYELAA